MSREVVDLLRRASILVADIRLLAEVTESLRPIDRARLQNIQHELIEIRTHTSRPVFMDQVGAG